MVTGIVLMASLQKITTTYDKNSQERRRSAVTGLLAISLFLALHPLVIEYYNTRFIGGAIGDGGLYVWLVQSFINDPLKALNFESNALYPYPLTRAWSDPFIIPAAVVNLFTVGLSLSLASAYNTLILLAFASNAVAASLLARRIGIGPRFATVAGVIFANSSFIVGNLGHPQLLFFFWVALSWWCVLPEESSSRVASRNWFLAGLCVAGAFYTSVYYAVFASIGLAVIWLRAVAFGGASPRRALRTLLFATLGAAPIFYALPAYLAIQSYFGERGLHEADFFAASGASYLALTPLHSVFGFSAALSHGEAYLSPGYLISALALVFLSGVCWRRSKILSVALAIGVTTLLVTSSLSDGGIPAKNLMCSSAWVVLIAALAFTIRERSGAGAIASIVIVFFILSFGPGGNPHKHEPVFSPLGALFYKVPGIAAIRAVGRYGVVVVLGAVFAAVLCVERFMQANHKVSLKDVPRGLVAAVFLIFGLLDNLVATIPFDAPVAVPRALSTLADRSELRGASVVLPFAERIEAGSGEGWTGMALLNSRYVLWGELAGTERALSLVNGYSGQRSKIQGRMMRYAQAFPEAPALDLFAKVCGLRYVVALPELYSRVQGIDEGAFMRKVNQNSSGLKALRRFDDGSILFTLARREVVVTGDEARVFFAPRDGGIELELNPRSSDGCLVKVSTLGRSIGASSEPVPVQVSEYLVKYKQAVTVNVPSGLLQRASPHLIEVRTNGCEVGVVCGVEGR
jgi:hypothetical protein